MKPKGSMPHSQELSNKHYPKPNQSNSTFSFKINSNIVLPSTPRDLLPLGLPINMFTTLLPCSILTTCPAHLNHLDLITLTILGER